MTLSPSFYVTSRPGSGPLYQLTSDNRSDVEAFLGSDYTYAENEGGSLTLTWNPGGGPWVPDTSVTIPINGYFQYTEGNWRFGPTVYATDPTSGTDAIFQTITPGQTYTLQGP